MGFKISSIVGKQKAIRLNTAISITNKFCSFLIFLINLILADIKLNNDEINFHSNYNSSYLDIKHLFFFVKLESIWPNYSGLQ